MATRAIGNIVASSGLVSRAPSAILGQTGFQQLLTAQMRSAGPLGAVTNGASSAGSGTQADLVLLHALTHGANLIGKTILYDKPGSSTPARGKVESLRVDNGRLMLVVGGKNVTLNQVRGIDT